MNIVVIGGSGLIGSKLVQRLRASGHTVLAASPDSGVNTVTGEGLLEALGGAEVVIDVANSPSFEGETAMAFFLASGRNLLAAEEAAGVRHHMALSVVGTDRLQASGYFRAKLAQENLIKRSGIPYTVLRSTQFFEFIGRIAGNATGSTVGISPAWVQPVAADDVAAALAYVAAEAAANAMLELGGPEDFRLSDLVQKALTANGDDRTVIADADADYFGARLGERTLLPGSGARIGPTRFDDWLLAAASTAGFRAVVPAGPQQPAAGA